MPTASASAFGLFLAMGAAVSLADRTAPTFRDAVSPDSCVSDDNQADGTVIYYEIDTATSTPADATVDPVTYHWGKCVQCTGDSHCGANEWCGPSFTVDAKWWSDKQFETLSAGDKATRLNKYAMLSGVSVPTPIGRCYKFGAYSEDESKKIGSDCDPGLQGTRPTKVPEDKSVDATCYFAWSWQPEKRKCVKSSAEGAADCPTATADPATDPYENAAKDTPGSCGAFIGGTTPAACTAADAWMGKCIDRKCSICKDGDTARSGYNVPQICIKGEWMPKMSSDNTIRTLAYNLRAQLSIAILFFLVWLWVIVFFTCCGAANAARKGNLKAPKM